MFILVEQCATSLSGVGVGIASDARTLVWDMVASQGEGMLYVEPGPPRPGSQRARGVT